MLERELGGRRLRGLVVAGVSLASLSALSVLAGASWAAVSSSSANQNQYGGKAVICHHTHWKTNAWVTITVSQAALKAHLRQGDTLGACSTSTPGHGHGHEHGQAT